ncbi:hypothetical protein FHW69_003840 [Luteibacter sp. Sphag1AF]|uniref:DUF6714 family protein n=1 Tax=Luteibacter sp. Sphag1AF TaxID=2587031 RepID=UPI001620D822|nr:DUF6714 family protein [Luteibacter sp. Sphag1AF]MBB3229181.1 hypothetical protein [Luteibacter sp. Sphag1AF]
MNLSHQINEAFATRQMPELVADTSRPHISDREDAESVSHLSREKLDWSLLQKHADALYAMTPAAFRYYLPRFMVVAMEPSDITPLFVSPILQMLDAGPDESYWSDRFRHFWLGMTVAEYEAVKAWLVFMASSDDFGLDDIVLARCFDTVDLLCRAGDV